MLHFRTLPLILFCTLISSLLFAQSQPTFDPGQDPKPFGKKWEKLDIMSDEFSGSNLNTTKWDDQDPQWEGRKPARFEKSSVSVGGGNLKIVASKKTNPFSGWTHNGGLVRSKSKTTYGYFETRMKANRTALSSTFWMINKRNDLPASSCDYRVTELDVTENVGIDAYPNLPNRGWVDQNIRSINSNTHSRQAPNGCGVNIDANGAKTPIGEEAWRDYHVYGVWWKNANEVIFFLDGQEVHRITPPDDFDLTMYLRMVVESYDWNKPRDGFDNMNLPLADRTTFYDWTRSWKLVDDPNSGGSSTVDCNTLPTNVTSATTINTSVAYNADQQRDVVIELWNTTTNSWLAQGSTTVSAGSGVANVAISIASAPPLGSNYQFKASIRPVGASWQSNIDACNRTGITLSGATLDPTVDCNSLPATLTSSTSISASINYTADQQRDVVVELWNAATNSWLAQGSETVSAGSGTANVSIGISSPPPGGSNYLLKASIRPVGASWQSNLDACNRTGVVMNSTSSPPTCDLPWSSPSQSITQQTVNWTSAPIDISCASGANISMNIEGLTPAQMEAADYLNVYYAVDGGSQIPISLNTDGFALKTVSANNVSGNSLVVIINGKTSWSDETYNINNISVVSSASSSGLINGGNNLLHTFEQEEVDLISVFPNPVLEDGNFTIDLGPQKGIKKLRIMDLQGRTVFASSTEESQVSLHKGDLNGKAGIYFISVQAAGHEDRIAKLVIN